MEKAQAETATPPLHEDARAFQTLSDEDRQLIEDTINYDKSAVRSEIHDSANRFATIIEGVWRGHNDEFHHVLNSEKYLLNPFIYALGAYSLFAATCIGADFLKTMNGATSALSIGVGIALNFFAVIFVVITYFSKQNKLFERLGELDHALYFEIEKYVDKQLISDLSVSVTAIPNGASSYKEIPGACQNMIQTFRHWRELERIPTYLRNHWFEYRMKTRDKRLEKSRLSYFVIAMIIILATSPYVLYALATSGLEASSPVSETIDLPLGLMQSTNIGELKIYLLMAGSFAMFTMVAYIIVMQSRMMLVLTTVNRGLRLKNPDILIAGIHKLLLPFRHTIPTYEAAVEDWREYIATKDPIPDIVSKYAQVLSGYVASINR